MPLSDAECREVLQSNLSYHPTDLLVVGWVAALVDHTRAFVLELMVMAIS